jgi:hypothetical protein
MGWLTFRFLAESEIGIAIEIKKGSWLYSLGPISIPVPIPISISMVAVLSIEVYATRYSPSSVVPAQLALIFSQSGLYSM